MASFGHLAVGLLAGRLQEGGRTPTARPCSRTATLIGFGVLGMLPDFDVFAVALGAGESTVAGHRGASHSLLTALAIGIAGGLIARRYGWSGLRTALALTLAIGSHGLIDSFAQGGRAIPLLWPLSGHRFAAPWRCFRDAPRGLRFISRDGLCGAALEFLYFFPVTAYALWPRRASRTPKLEVLVSGAESSGVRMPATVTGPLSAARLNDAGGDRAEREDSSLRSSG